ncbi:MAG: DUF697 domain-containing protein [Pegethrix bostrychoides GSE-TBD4-15B]|jgi:hypothetical protein|uniref:DUF697 domain-containing protein n=1 Tax=Pegethrix bostrychoides GSE-TBD4-15B TaxID=2839662 RepID=A0A951U3Q8_9CYAN|nr:DUF697 domain-containing protein [Pegethrix bostrychoides GSE-TBD4-15B]
MTSELLKRPILLGGLGITAAAWLLQGFDPGVIHLGSTAVWSAIAVGSGLWWFKQMGKPQPIVQTVQTIDRAVVEQRFQAVTTQIDQLAQELLLANSTANSTANSAEPAEPEITRALRQKLAALGQELERQMLRVAVLGSASVGKTALAQALPESLMPVAEVTLTHSSPDGSPDLAQLSHTDLVLFVICGDLSESDFQTVQTLLQQHYRLLVLFNKQDQYLPADRPVILQQIRNRLHHLLEATDIIGISAQPAPLKVRQHQADGTVEDRIEQPTSELLSLQTRLQQAIEQPKSLVLATVFRQTEALSAIARAELNQLRRRRAMPVVEQYQWVAAAAAFANPLPSLDLLTTATINAQMVMDLGALYHQQFSLDQAKTVAASLGSQMVKLGLVEMASQAISPLLKSHALTYVAGGTLQGLSAAYLTRVAGLSLVEYFEEQSQSETTGSVQIDGLVQKVKAVFQDNQRSAFLKNLVKQGLARLPQAAPGAGA